MGNPREKNRNNLIKGYNMMLYFAGSMIVYEPTQDCVTDFWSKGILKTLPVSSSNPRFVSAASQLRESCSDKGICRERLTRDFNRLFSDQPTALAPPLQSFYEAEAFPPELVSGRSATDFYKAHGWSPRQKLPDEHLGTMLLFLTILLDKFTAIEDEAARTEMAEEIRNFIFLHVLSWIPSWHEKMQANALTLCYKGIATLIYASVEDILALLATDRPN